ncbi:MAG TPA: helix-turn-helix domain-containing protein [Pseudonocardia sp.]|nr:helix-turn-helix domain-containing protein [Pseudonocardia sp.]
MRVSTPDKLWSVTELSDYLGVPVATLYQWRSRGYGPPGRRLGRHVRYLPEQVRDWVRSMSTGVA